MAIFDKELIDNTSNRDYGKPEMDLRSPETRKVDVSLGGFEDFAIGGPSRSSGLTIDQLSDFSRIPTNQNTFNSPVQMIPRSELLANQRYNIYERNRDLENVAGLQQSWADQLANGVVKFAAIGGGTFLQSFGTIPNTVAALKTGKLSELSGGPDGYESKIDTWLKNIEDSFPNYYTRREKESPFLAALPFAPGSANFWGDKIIKNLGFTAGAIGGAVVQDLAIGAVTEGIGAIPLVAAQIGKASLYLNKLFTGTNRLDEVLNLATQLGKTEKQILNIKRLGEVAAATKVTDGARYALNIYGSARTEAAIEARDGYKQVRENLINQYKLENLGEEPTGADAKQIEDLATNAMNTRFGINMALLTVSNAVQFGNLFKSFSKASSSGISGSLTRELEDIGKFGLKEGSIDVFESKAAKTLRGKIWESVKPKVANIFTEGVYEEGGQFAAERGTFDYYTRKYKNLNDPNNRQNWNELNEVINSTNKGLADQYGSEEGLENMFVGALSALISGGIMSRIDSVKGKGADARLQSTINMLNRYGITGMLQDNYTDTLNSAAIAKEMDAAAKSGNIFKYKNLKKDMFFNFVNSRIPSGMHDVTLEQLNMLKDLSKEEFEKTFGMDFNTSNKNTVDAYVDNLISNANKIKSTVDSLDSTFKNPFAKITDPKTPEEAVAANNHDVFNEWKTNLAYYAMVAPDANDRLSSISQTVAGVNPLINNDLLGKLTDPTSLRELSSNYEERANQLNRTITEFTSPEDKKAIKAQVKALRTSAERINLAINNRDLDMKTFNSLLNFELNNLDSTKDDVVGMERASELYGYGVDINKLIGLKRSASSILDELASESGLEKFFKEASEIASEEPPTTVPGEEEAPAAEVTPAVVPQYTNVKGKRENLELNREYEVAKLRPSKVNRLAEDRWQVISPDGTFEIYPTKEKAQEIAKDLDEEFASLAKVKIVALNEDGTAKVEDKDGNIYNIDTRKLSGFNKVESEQEKLQKIADQLGRQQQEVEKKSGIVATGNPSLETFEKEDPKKSANILYTSTTGASETWEQLAKPHQVRSRQFLNNVKNFGNRANMKIILVTPNQEESLGLKGLGELSGSTDTSVENGLVAAVYVVQSNGKNYFVDKDGKQLTEVGQPVDMNVVVFSTMPTAALYNSKGDPRFRKQEEAQAKEMSRAWTVKRAELFAAPAGTYTIYDFGVSKGVPITDRNERKFVGDNLVPQKKIATQENLIVISTTGTLAYNGENLKFPVGRPVLQYGDTLQYVDNRTFTNDEAKSIFEAIRLLSEEVQSQNAKGETIELNRLYTDFLQNVLYWRKGKDTKDNQIHIDERSMELYIGGDKYNFADIASNEAAIVSKLKGTFNNVNNESLKKTSEPFIELYFEDGFLQNREWVNYQSYLLSSKYPNGKNRSITDTPLSTYVNKPTDAVPYNYVRKYAILEGLDLPVQQAAPAAAPVAEAAPSADKLGEFFVNGTENTISLKEPLGETKFTATINSDGNVVAEVISNPRIQAIAANAEKAKPYLDFLKNTMGTDGKPLFDATKSVEDSILQFAALNISARLQAIKNQQAAAPVVTTAATVTQTTPYGTEAAPAVVTSTESLETEEQPTVAVPALISPVIQSSLDMLSKAQELLDAQSKRFEKYIPAVQKYLDTKKQQLQDPKLTVEQREKIAKTIEMDMKIPIVSLNNLVLEFAPNGRPEKIYINNPETKESYNFTTYFQENGERNFKNNPNYAFNRDERLGQGSDYGYDIVTKNSIIPIEGLNLREAETLRHFLSGADSGATQYAAHDTDNLGQGLLMGVIKHYFIEKAAGRMQRDYWDYLQDPRKEMREQIEAMEAQPIVAPVTAAPVVSAEDAKKKADTIYRLKMAISERENDIIPRLKEAIEELVKNREKLKLPSVLSNTSMIGPINEKIKEYEETLERTSKGVEELKELLAELEGPTAPKNFGNTKPPSNSEYRRVGANGVERINDAEIEIFKKWAAENVPGIPFEILDNIISTNDGEKAWGAFENGVAKFYKSAARGTEYHEVFEGIWKAFLTEEQRQAILDEFKSKPGTFTDRQSGKKIAYDQATDKQAKERIADDFADFKVGKLPARSIGERILNFFRNIIEFVKQFVNKPTQKQELFKAINAGKFKEMTVPESVKNDMSEYRAVEGLSEKQTHEFVQDITARSFQIMFGTNTSLYNPEKLTAPDIFNQVKSQYAEEGKLEMLGENAWNQLVNKTKEFLRTFKLEFDENQSISINDENVNKNDYAPEPFSTDWKKSSSFAIKLLIGTLTETTPSNQENASSMALPAQKLSDVMGYKLLNFTRSFATVLDKLANTTKVTSVVDKLIDLAKYDSNYVRLFTRVGGNRNNMVIDFSKFEAQDWRLFVNFYQTFTKQKPDALIQYVSGDEVYTGSANLYTAANSVKEGWIENMKALSKVEGSLISYDRGTKTYKVGDLTNVSNKTPEEMITFLGNLGIEFPMEVYSKLKTVQKNKFANAIGGLIVSLRGKNDILSVTGKVLDINGPLSLISELYVKVTNPNIDATYFNVENRRTNSFAENNAPSLFENLFNEANTLDELLEARPELKDIFSASSQVLKKGGLFFDEDGNRIRSIKVSYIQGTKLVDENDGTATSRLTEGERFTQEFNQNLNGNYYVLIPADGSTEWMMNLGNNVRFSAFENGTAWGKIYTTFKGYLKDEINLALTAASRTQLMNVGNKASELRFFNDILSKDTLASINNLIAKEASEEEINAFIEANIGDINKSIKDYIDGVSDVTFKTLAANGEIYVNTKGEYSYPKLDDVFAKAEKFNKFKLSEKKLKNIISFANANYIINNIEYHKILFGDPYQFKIKDNILDETKRVKSFLSGRRTTFDFPDYNTFLNQELNKAGEIELNEGDPGFQKFKPYTNTITLKDVKVLGRLLGETNEADAASYLMDGTYREVKNKNGQWSDEAEDWHQWQMAYTRNKMAAKGDYAYTNDSLRAQDEKTISKPEPKYVTEVLKPIVTGNKYGSTQFDLVLDKFSQMPLYYKAVEGTNLEKLYVKMMKEDIGYVIFESGRKVGTETLYSLYNGDGSLNDAGFDNKIQVPWSAYGIQVENSYEGSKQQTRGSQVTKLASLNLFNNGVATSPEAAKEYSRNKEILDRMHENGYNELLRKLGIEDLGDGFKLTNNVDVSKLLEYEMLRREMSDNAKDTVQLDENGQFRIPFEASNAYVQIRNILYSMVDKAITSPKMNGGPKVQVPVTGWEDAKAGRKIALKTKDGFKEISKVEYNNLSEEDKKKVRLTDDTLKFYTKDQPYCEVLLPHWFKVKFGKKFPNDEALLNYLNSTEEGRSILTGVGFRIPTQELSNIEVFRVKGFLPQFMGDTIVVPSEITTKAGSDFDIDKLNTYLKATYLDKNGDIRLVKYKGSEEATKEFYANVFDETLENKKIKKANLLEAAQILTYGLEDPNNLVDRYSNLLDALLEDVSDSTDFEDVIMKQLEKMGDATLQAELKDKFVRDMYKKSLENEYYDSLTKLLTLPENFERLISPIGDAGLKDLASKLDKLRGYDESTIKNRMLDRNYLTKLRHAFVTAKRWVGIAAVNITNHSLTQKISAYIDPSKFELVNEVDRKILGDGKVALPHNTVNVNGEERISLSSILDKAGKYISGKLSGYATAFVDVAKDPYILKIIGSDLAVGTFMYLERIGVPIETTAMFMNQPIVKEYLTYLDNTGARGLFNQKNIDAVKSKFVTTGTLISSAGVSVDTLEDNISEYYSKGELSEPKNAEQHVILNEFLKYAKMAEYLFNFGQAINYDTTKFRSGDALFKKETRTEVAEDINIISSVNELLDASFIGKQAELIASSMEAMGEIFKLEKDEFRVITNSILKSFAKDQYLSADDYDRIANKLKASFLDYIIQTKSGLNSEIKALLVDAGTSVASQLAEAKRNNPGLTILNDLQVVSSDRVDGAKSIKLLANNKDAYDENLYTGYMRELRDNSSTTELYKNIVKLSILQGTYQTGISIKNIIPIEDYSKIIAPVIAPLVSNDSLLSFAQGAFQRNNWKDEKIFGKVKPKFFLAQESPIAVDIYDNDIYQYFSPAFPNIKNLGIKSTDRKILLLSERYNAASLKYDFVKVPRVVEDPFTGTRVNMTNGENVTNSMFAIKKSKGDLSLKDIYGYQKVKYADGSPVIVYDDKGVGSHVYKLINLYGDGQLASEYYENNIPSVLNNGTVKIANEITDEEIIAHYGGQTQPKVVPLQSMDKTIQMQPANIEKIKAGTKTATIRSQRQADEIGIPVGQTQVRTIGGLPYNITNRGLLTIEEAGGKEKMLKDDGAKSENDLMYQQTKDWVNGKGRLYVYDIAPVTTETQPVIEFQEEPTSGYKNRTIKNASADATIAFAYNFNSAGEKLTKSSVLEQNKKYIPLAVPTKTETSDINKADITSQVNVIVDQLNSVNAKTLNIAGNGIYTMREAGWNQEEVDLMTYRILKGIVESPNLKNKIESIRTGGQTGFDEAGAKAGIKLGIPTTILAPKGWKFRNISGQDISNEQQFKARFGQVNETQSTKPQPVIDSSKKINIYAGTGENAELSNFANRPFTTADGVGFENVEGAFQAAKLLYSSVYNSPEFGLTPSFYDMLLKFQEYSGANAKELGGKIKGLNTKAWDANSSRIMKELMKASFEQNPSALKALLATGNAELTHTQESPKSKWRTEFPKLLMEVREELKPKPGLSAYVTLEQLEADKSFLNTAIEFVDEISTNKDVPVAMRNLNKGEKIQMVKDLMQKKFDDKAWTSPVTQADGSKATALPAEQFKSFNEFLTFALLHEKAHETISKVSGETIGQYEDRINAAALNNMPKPPAEFEGDLEGADNPNPCGQ
jgi:predicted NAD-dependent protein-ADP-ribosyltransferase YbiA (DUF1768 family)